MTPENPLLTAALGYADAGLYVLPIYPTDEAGVCSCPEGAACKSPGKHPLTGHGLHDATTKGSLIEAWWARLYPRANIGIATGPSHLVVIDVDGKDGHHGPENWRLLVEELGPELENTAIVETASGTGFHVYFDAGEMEFKSVDDVLDDGIEVKALGRYVLAAGSVIGGRTYAYREGHGLDRLRPLPAVLAARLRAQGDTQDSSDQRREIPKVIAETIRNTTLASLAGSMRRRGLDEDEITPTLLAVNERRFSPPLAEREVRGIAKGMMRYEPDPDGDIVVAGRESGGEQRRLRPVSMAELAGREPEDVPAVLPFYAFAGCITDIAAQPKTGKTTFLLSAARAVCRGDPFLGGATHKGRVIYLTEESLPTFVSAVRRVGADAEADLYPVFRREAFGMSWSEICDEVRACAEELGAVLVIVDTLSDWANIRGDDENSAGKALEALAPLRALADVPGLAVIVARHERKSGGEVGEAARGSSQFVGGVDVVVSMRRTKGDLNTRRTLQALSRLDATPEAIVVEFVGGRFVNIGAAEGLQRVEKEERVLALLPTERQQAVALADLLPKLEPLSEATVRRVLERLVNKGLAMAAKGAARGHHRTAMGYWRLVPGGAR